MSESVKHTPGPWVATGGRYEDQVVSNAVPWHWKNEGRANGGRRHYPRIHGEGDGHNNWICCLSGHGESWGYNDTDEMQANARLIAAAPDMYAAIDQGITDLQAMANYNSGNDDNPYLQEMIDHLAEMLGKALAKAKGQD